VNQPEQLCDLLLDPNQANNVMAHPDYRVVSAELSVTLAAAGADRVARMKLDAENWFDEVEKERTAAAPSFREPPTTPSS